MWVAVAQVFKTHLFLDTVVSVGGPDGNKFLFSNENKLVQNRWPPSMIKILGKETVINQVGEEHRYCGGLIFFCNLYSGTFRNHSHGNAISHAL